MLMVKVTWPLMLSMISNSRECRNRPNRPLHLYTTQVLYADMSINISVYICISVIIMTKETAMGELI